MIEDLFELVGGPSTVTAATERFYERVLQDDNLRQFFESVDMAQLRSRQAMFVSMLLAGTVYTGKNIHDAHASSRHHGLNDVHFNLFLDHFRAALEEVGVKAENAEIIRKRLESQRGTVLDT
jgi:truncated hemoglobin YjbI